VSNVVSLNAFVYKLLIENDLNNFTVTDIRNFLLKISTEFVHEDEARRFIYRQLVKLVDKKLLSKVKKDNAKQFIYTKTALFNEIHFVSKTTGITKTKTSVTPVVKINFIDILSKEKHAHEADLAVVLCEVEEYKELINRFPDQVDYLKSLYLDARDRSVQLLGKINAVGRVLDRSNLVEHSC